jgi:hypothetical protein
MTKKNRFRLIAANSINCDFRVRLAPWRFQAMAVGPRQENRAKRQKERPPIPRQ